METGNVIFVMLDGIERHELRKIGQTIADALHLRDEHLIVLRLVVRDAIVQNVKQQIVGQTILLGKSFRRNGFELGTIRAGLGKRTARKPRRVLC